ncbi:hypothetical protein CC77DRAFT_268422 [Alternaria alternata]|uniref:Uncharacterized protein n=1 Tax=Alternaria alternata TaxID=5599 RepID=A0A177DDX5_ALTAL|nr:hypothetical protein CC77DRAFT_268422 [Alternaria alternata]OAG17686.1 hypothetical protein CC77DRAFT_268422 [Alternaria alternata]
MTRLWYYNSLVVVRLPSTVYLGQYTFPFVTTAHLVSLLILFFNAHSIFEHHDKRLGDCSC